MTPVYKTSKLRRSFQMSKKSKKQSYGYYKDLCKKYGFNIVQKSIFEPSMIMEIERQNLINLKED